MRRYYKIILGEFVLAEYSIDVDDNRVIQGYRINPNCAVRDLLVNNNYTNVNNFVNVVKQCLPMAARFDVRVIHNISGKFEIQE